MSGAGAIGLTSEPGRERRALFGISLVQFIPVQTALAQLNLIHHDCIRSSIPHRYGSGTSGTGLQVLSGLKSSIFLKTVKVSGPKSFS